MMALARTTGMPQLIRKYAHAQGSTASKPALRAALRISVLSAQTKSGSDGPDQTSNNGSSSHTGLFKEAPYLLVKDDKDFKPKYESSCVCGAVKYAVNCEPKGAKFCHCCSCQRLHGAPFQWAAVFPKDAVRFIQGTDKLGFLNTIEKVAKHELPCKVSCTSCHSPLASEGRNMWMGFVTLFDFPDRKVPENFQPDSHIFYAERCMDVNDGKDKWAAFANDSEKIPEHHQK